MTVDHAASDSHHHHGKGIKNLVSRFRSGSLGFISRQGTPDSDLDGSRPISRRSDSPKSGKSSRDSRRLAEQSLSIWNTAYDSLRDDPGSAALVLAYESIISQELPDHLKSGGMNTSFRGRSDAERLQLLTYITETGVHRRRSSKSSQVDEAARSIIDFYKDAVKLSLLEEPAAAVAWAGFCTLTPLSLDPILRLSSMRTGMFHVSGRILWYMSLPTLLMRDHWKDESDFDRSLSQMREMTIQLSRKILEFEMNCTCAAASSWNATAKNVVGWSILPALTANIVRMDAEIADHISRFAKDSVVNEMLQRNKDFVEPPVGSDDTEHNTNAPSSVVAA